MRVSENWSDARISFFFSFLLFIEAKVKAQKKSLNPPLVPLLGRIRLRRIKKRRNSCACRALSNAKTRRTKNNVLENENAGERRKGNFCWENYNKKSAPAVDAVGRNVMTRLVSYDTGKILERMRNFWCHLKHFKYFLMAMFLFEGFFLVKVCLTCFFKVEH